MDNSDPHLTMAQRRIGTVLSGRYTIDRVLGVGGMAVVYAATHRNQKRVAIKMLHPELSHHVEIRQRFLREGYVANTIKNRGAVDVIDDDVADDGAAYLVMELLEGETVEGLVGTLGGRVDVATALAIGQELCSVMAAAHVAGVVHRDIKPANLFVTTDGDVKLLDFGIARLRESGEAVVTNAGMLLGTPGFMSPEQALGHTYSIGPHTDTWAIGATLFSLLTGHTVHEGQTGPEIVVKAATRTARSIRTILPELPPVVVDLIDKSLRFERAERWVDASEMAAMVREARRALYGDASPQSVLAPLVGGVPRIDHSPSQPSPPSMRSPKARTIDAPDAPSTTAIPVSTTPFVQPLASKGTLVVAAAGMALLLATGAWFLMRTPKDDSSGQVALQPPAASAPLPTASATPVTAPIAAASTSDLPASNAGASPIKVATTALPATGSPTPIARPKVVVDAGATPPSASVPAPPVPAIDPGAVR